MMIIMITVYDAVDDDDRLNVTMSITALAITAAALVAVRVGRVV